MTAIPVALQVLQLFTALTVPAGSQLKVRMNTPVASWSTAVDTPIQAVLIAPVTVRGEMVLPAGCKLAGRVRSVTRVGLGIRHERASVGLEFFSLALPGGSPGPIDTRVSEVDNSRERIGANGLVQGVRATNSIAYRVSGYLKMALLWHCHAALAEWAIKSLVVQLPEPEIYYPSGTELTLSTTVPWLSPFKGSGEEVKDQIAPEDLAALDAMLAELPYRTIDGESGLPSDLTNVLFVGSRGEILTAFRAAGWSLADNLTLRTRIRVIRAAAELRGYPAPMANLLLNGAEADMSLQKSLNDVSKRHHIRIWKQPGLWNGQEVWLAAATHDIDYAYLRPGRAFGHRIDRAIDDERDKVAYDLAFTSCTSPIDWRERPQVPRSARNGTGDSFSTDGRISIIRFHECSAEQPPIETNEFPTITRGGKWQRLLRREILITRNDFLRANPYWRLYEAGFRTLSYLRSGNRDLLFETPLLPYANPDASRWRKALDLGLAAIQ